MTAIPTIQESNESASMASNEMSGVPEDTARLIQEVLSELGWSANASTIAKQVHRLNIGLQCEDEFSVVCAWLGRCQLIHKLDQQQVPITSREQFQVPDLLAMFSPQVTLSPVLIEVKSNTKQTLSFRPDYLKRLQNYAALLGLPLLIAWKHHSFWVMFEARHLRKAHKNFNISLDRASQENLLGVLAGDVSYKVGKGAGVHLSLRKQKLLNQEVTGNEYTQDWQVLVESITFSDYEGALRTDLNAEIQSLFASFELEQRVEHTTTHIYHHFVAGPEPWGMQFAHSALVRLLNWESPDENTPQWRRLLKKEQITKNIQDFTSTLSTALDQKIVSHIFHQVPLTEPAFLLPQP